MPSTEKSKMAATKTRGGQVMPSSLQTNGEFDNRKSVDILETFSNQRNKLMKISILLSAFALLSSVLICFAEESKTPKAGEAAPKVVGKDQNGKDWKLEEALGK